MTAAVVIVTKNRRDDLRTAIRSAVAQTGPVEVIVVDDGSTDGTSAMVREEFPTVRVETRAESRGYVVRRNEAARVATADVIVSIDDDAELVSPTTVTQSLQDFDHPRIGAIAIPCIEPNRSDRILQRPPSPHGQWVTDCFVGTAYAVRRDIFLAVGGFRGSLIHQGEERDFCLRMLAAGWVVRLGRADALHHYESPNRSTARMDYYGRRNDILFAWHHVPHLALAPHLVGTTINAVRSAARAGRWRDMMRGTMAGYAGLHSIDRAPVTTDIYRLHRRLKTAAAVPLTDVLADLPAVANGDPC